MVGVLRFVLNEGINHFVNSLFLLGMAIFEKNIYE